MREAVKVWTLAEEAVVERLWHEGQTDEQIGRRLGRSEMAIRVKRQRMKLIDEERHKTGKGHGQPKGTPLNAKPIKIGSYAQCVEAEFYARRGGYDLGARQAGGRS